MSEARRILEYISNPLIWFKNYLTMSDEQKEIDIAYKLAWDYYENYAEASGIDLPDGWDNDITGYVDELPEEQRRLFGKWLLNNIDHDNTIENPAWMYMDFESIVQNTWLVHMTDDAAGIAKRGFQYGLEDFQEIAYTKHRKPQPAADRFYTYCFSYELSDFKRYASKLGGYKYGDEAVVFRASGVKIHHYGDEEPQVIFLASSATNIVPIYSARGDYYWVPGGERGELFKAENIEDCAYWVAANFEQYRKILSKEGKEKG